MQNVFQTIKKRREEAYLKLRSRFVKSLKSGNFEEKSRRQKHHLIDRLKTLESQLGLRSTPRLKHWAMAAALGFVTVTGYGQDHKDSRERRPLRFNPEKERKENRRVTTSGAITLLSTNEVDIFDPQPFLGDPWINEDLLYGDFDEDGDEDLLVYSYYGATRLFVNDGTGFNEEVVIREKNYEIDEIAIADIDGDGDLDILLVEDVYTDGNDDYIVGNNLIVLENQGANQFVESIQYFENVEFERLEIADMDDDDDPDLVTSVYVDGVGSQANIYTNDGTGTFSYFSQLGTVGYDFALGDFDGDGDLDLADRMYDSYIRVFRNDGTGSFNEEDYIQSAMGSFLYENQVADVDNDGYVDIIYTENNELVVLQNNGSGVFTSSVILSREGGVGIYHDLDEIDLADMDADGDLDILVDEWYENQYENIDSNTLTLLTNNGGLDFTESSLDLQVNVGNADEYLPVDIDGDGDYDMVASNYFDIVVYQNDGSQNFTVYDEDLIEVVYGIESVFADVDGDGDQDVISSGLTMIGLNDGAGNLSIGQHIARESIFFSYAMATGDFDGDGDIDAVFAGEMWANGEEVLQLWKNNGSGNFSMFSDISADWNADSMPDDVDGLQSADMDGDGDLDLIGLIQYGSYSSYLIGIWINDGAGNFTQGESIQEPSIIEAMQVADLDGDDDPDVVASGESGVFIFLNEGGSLSEPTIYLADQADWNNQDLGDIDGDGDIDIVVLNENYNIEISHAKLLNNGDGTFESGTLSVTSFGYGGAVLADFDLDGDLDLYIAGIDEDYEDEFWAGDGAGNFTKVGSLGLSSYYPAVGDIDGDGDLDLFVTEYYQSSRVILNTTNAVETEVDAAEADSLAISAFYNATGGESWVRNDNWLTGEISTWHGITVNEEGRVTEIALDVNGLVGAIPESFKDLTSLTVLSLSGNELTGLPDLSALPLTTFDVSENKLTFEDLEPNADKITAYTGQALFGELQVLEAIEGDDITLDPQLSGAGENDVYQWQKGNEDVTGANEATLLLSDVQMADGGSYVLKVTNSLFPDLTLSSQPIGLSVALNTALLADSLALLSIYEVAGGENWGNITNWKEGLPLSEWTGVTVTDGRVTGLDLSSNGLTGEFPLVEEGLEKLTSLNLSDNELTGTADLSNLEALTQLDVSNNRVQFGTLESLISSFPFVVYAPQKEVLDRVRVVREIGTEYIVDRTVTGSDNTYSWSKDGTAINENGHSFTIPVDGFAVDGIYVAEVTNPNVESLVLTTRPVVLRVSSLERDSTSLRTIYDALVTDQSTISDWTSLPMSEWEEITITDSRVTAIDLSDLSLAGALPEDILDLQELTAVDISGNEIHDLPAIGAGLPKITAFDVSGNRLEFDDLEPNVEMNGINYAGQRRFGTVRNDTIASGESFTVQISTGGTANSYQWEHDPYTAYYAGPQDGTTFVAVSGATISSYAVEAINYETMGRYRLTVTNELVPDLTLTSRTQQVWANATATFTVLGDEGVPLGEGFGYALKYPERRGPLDSAAVVTSVAGKFSFDLVLGDYLFAFEGPEGDAYLPTYFPGTDLWVEADTFEVRSALEENTMTMARLPEPLPPLPDGGVVKGFVESNFADEEENEDDRVQARRKVKKAGCSMRRRTRGGGGRTGQEEDAWTLVAYVETNDEGEFEFGDLPDGTYRFNIEYPGIPMNPDSFVEFEIGANGVEGNEFTLEAYVTEEGIDVIRVNELGFYRKYFKDLQVYPNPADNVLKVSYSKLVSDRVQVQLMDLEGRVVLQQAVQHGFDQGFDLDVSKLKEGIYLLSFIDPTERQSTIIGYKVYVRH